MGLPSLLTFSAVSATLGLRPNCFRMVAEDHGLTIGIGRASRRLTDGIEELLGQCRVKGKSSASIGGTEKTAIQSGNSGMESRISQSGPQFAKKLKV